MNDKEKEIIKSYNDFMFQIDIKKIRRKIICNKFLFVISIVLFLYFLLSSISDMELITRLFNIYVGLICLVVSIVLFMIAWKKRSLIEMNFHNNYKHIFENILNIKLDDTILSDKDYEKLNKSEYIAAGFDYADEKYGFYYQSSKKILINKNLEAFLVQIDKGRFNADDPMPHYIIDGYITKQKINNDKKNIMIDTNKIIKQFNKEYNTNIKTNIVIKIYNGYLYILFDKIDIYFLYYSLIKYDTYKRIYTKLKFIEELSEFVYNSIN